MARTRTFARGEVFPSYFVNQIQEMVGSEWANFRIVPEASGTAVTVPAGGGDDQAAVAIDGFWRYRTTPVSRTPSGGAGVYDLFVTAAAESIAPAPLANTDNTNRSFDLILLASGVTPTVNPGVLDIFRLIARVGWDGTYVTYVAPVVHDQQATDPVRPAARSIYESPLYGKGFVGQTADLLRLEDSTGALRLAASAGGMLSIAQDVYARSGGVAQAITGAVGPGGEAGLSLGTLSDARLFRSGVGALALTGALTLSSALAGTSAAFSGVVNAASYQVGGVALAASNLSNGTTGSGAVALAGSPTFTGTLTASAGTFSSLLSASGTGGLSLTAASGAGSSGGAGIGDKLQLYNSAGFALGFGVQVGRLVAYVGAGTSFAVRPASVVNDLSSGVDAVTLSDAGIVNVKTGGGFQINGVALAASNLSNGTTGTGAIALAASPAFTGTLTIGADTNLYRSAANTLKTDDSLHVGDFTSASAQLRVHPAGLATDSAFLGLVNDRGRFGYDGTAVRIDDNGTSRAIRFYSGAANNLVAEVTATGKFSVPLALSAATGLAIGGDTTLYRSAANELTASGKIFAETPASAPTGNTQVATSQYVQRVNAAETALQPGIQSTTDGLLTFNSASQVTISSVNVLWARNSQGLLVRGAADGVISGIPVAGAGTTRLDQIVYDSDTGVVTRVAGTQSAGVSLTNRTGAAGLGSQLLRLYDLLITPTGVVNSSANIRDRRSWARGFRGFVTYSAASLTTTSATAAPLTVYQMRAEVLNPVVVHLAINRMTSTGAGFDMPWFAGSEGTSQNVNNFGRHLFNDTAHFQDTVLELVPGSHLIRPYWTSVDNTSTQTINGAFGSAMYVTEMIGMTASSNNGIV